MPHCFLEYLRCLLVASIPLQLSPLFSKRPRTAISGMNVQRSFTRHAPRERGACHPVDLVGVHVTQITVLAGIEQIQAVVHQPTPQVESEPVGACPRRGRTVGNAEAHGFRLVRDDVHVLPARRGLVDGLERNAVPGRTAAVGRGAVDDQRLRVGLVLDPTQVGGTVGVEQAVGLDVVDVEIATADLERVWTRSRHRVRVVVVVIIVLTVVRVVVRDGSRGGETEQCRR